MHFIQIYMQIAHLATDELQFNRPSRQRVHPAVSHRSNAPRMESKRVATEITESGGSINIHQDRLHSGRYFQFHLFRFDFHKSERMQIRLAGEIKGNKQCVAHQTHREKFIHITGIRKATLPGICRRYRQGNLTE